MIRTERVRVGEKLPYNDNPMPDIETSVRRYLLKQAKQIVGCERRVQEFDVEAVHDMRVASRRARSVLRAVSDLYPKRSVRKVRGKLRRIGRALGAVRDKDMWLLSLEEHLRQDSFQEAASIRDRWSNAREAACKDVLALIDEGAAREAASDLTEIANAGMKRRGNRRADFSRKRIREAFRAFDTLAKSAATASMDDLHELRIQAKRLRYTIEVLLCSKPAATKSFIQPLVALQDHLGLMQEDRLAREDLESLDGPGAAAYGQFLKDRVRARKAQVGSLLGPLTEPSYIKSLLSAAKGAEVHSQEIQRAKAAIRPGH